MGMKIGNYPASREMQCPTFLQIEVARNTASQSNRHYEFYDAINIPFRCWMFMTGVKCALEGQIVTRKTSLSLVICFLFSSRWDRGWSAELFLACHSKWTRDDLFFLAGESAFVADYEWPEFCP